MTPKCCSVQKDGTPDGWTPSEGWKAEATPDGITRIAVSVSPERTPEVHMALIRAMDGPYGVMYLQLTDRRRGRQNEKPARFLSLEHGAARLEKIFAKCPLLIYGDGRHQLWVRSKLREQVVLDETGTLFAYPDDPAFRDALTAVGVPEAKVQTMAERDYVKVELHALADPQEEILIRELGLSPYD